MVVFSSAKINLGLFVRDKRDDGYHNIETIFLNLPDYKDVIEILPSETGKDDFVFYGRDIQGDISDNLIFKAIDLMRRDYPQTRVPLKVVLLKNLPMGAGLGGGSSNAAHTLVGMNKYFQLNLSQEVLEKMAIELGSDCPFFIHKQTCVAEGRGEIFTPVDIDLGEYSIQVITPDIHISTAMAFHNLRLEDTRFTLHEVRSYSVETWKDVLKNDFETSVFPMFPEIEDIKKQLYNSGAAYASLSGSGSSVYGIFPKNKKATVVSTVAFQEFYCI